MFDLATAAVEGALAAGAGYADARAVLSATEGLQARNGVLEGLQRSESAGVGVRALIGSSWGFFATSDLGDRAARRAGEEAAAIARASGRVPGSPLELADVPVVEDHWDSGWDEHPRDVSLAEKGDLLVGATATMAAVAGVSVAEATVSFWDTEKWFVSSQGHRISQHIVESGSTMSATAVGEHETQRRSWGGIGGHWGTRGYELVRATDLPGNAPRVAEEAVALLSAPHCPAGVTDLILGPEQLGLQIHESVGHAIELDRILGWEAAFAGTSFLDLSRLGRLRYGSEHMNVTADATLPGALGTFGYDDEGTPASRVDIVREGTWVGVLTGRDSAAVAGLPPGGMVRADGWARLPIVRMTNVGLLPGDSSLEEMVAATADGIYMETNRSWSIDDKRLNFQFGCEVGREVKDGKLGRLLRNPTYTGITPQFWGSLDMVGGPDEWIFWGTPNCGKGQPSQWGHTGHPSVPARFRGVQVGVRG
ncbi:MAG TPA: TldD/PmbA family protein [Acidimicrobiales bacterium]|nr:TldD/PmbA family protein [Acidimicrobiales bacterium]